MFWFFIPRVLPTHPHLIHRPPRVLQRAGTVCTISQSHHCCRLYNCFPNQLLEARLGLQVVPEAWKRETACARHDARGACSYCRVVAARHDHILGMMPHSASAGEKAAVATLMTMDACQLDLGFRPAARRRVSDGDSQTGLPIRTSTQFARIRSFCFREGAIIPIIRSDNDRRPSEKDFVCAPSAQVRPLVPARAVSARLRAACSSSPASARSCVRPPMSVSSCSLASVRLPA